MVMLLVMGMMKTISVQVLEIFMAMWKIARIARTCPQPIKKYEYAEIQDIMCSFCRHCEYKLM